MNESKYNQEEDRQTVFGLENEYIFWTMNEFIECLVLYVCVIDENNTEKGKSDDKFMWPNVGWIFDKDKWDKDNVK